MDEAFTRYTLKAGKWVMHVILLLVLLAMIAATIDFGIGFAEALWKPDPWRFTLSVSQIMSTFGLALHIVVGYELLKSIVIVLRAHIIPVVEITRIAAIALLNKFITMEYHHDEPWKYLVAAAALLAVALAYYSFSRPSAEPPVPH